MVTLKERVTTNVAISASGTEDLGSAFSTTGSGAERVTGALATTGSGTLRVDLEWQDEDGTTILTETGVGNPFDKPIVAPKLQVRGTETGGADPVTVTLATFMQAS